MDETDGSSVEGLEPTPIHLVQSLWNVYVRVLPEEPSEIASEIGISRFQGGVLVTVFN